MSTPLTLWRRPFALLTLLVLLAPALGACGGGAPATEAPAATSAPAATEAPAAATEAPAAETAAATAPAASAGDTGEFLVFGGSGEPDTLDSMNTTAGTALIVTAQIQETLVDFVPGTLDLQPGLAESWEANADSTEWTFTLREGVTFHDGEPFNAEAVVFNFQRLSDPEFEFGFRDEGNTFPIFPDIFGGFVGEPNTIWAGVEATDENTVVFRLTKPFSLFPNIVAANYFGISSPKAVRDNGIRYGTPEVGGVGTGPFRFVEWQPGQSLTLERNDEYYGEQARMPGLVVRFLDDAAARLAELQAGSVDFTINLSPDARPTIEGDSNLALTAVEPFNIAYLSMNMNNKPFDDVRVRQAIAHAINKEEILEAYYGGIGNVATDFLPEGLAWARPDNPEAYPYDPERARQLLAEAGYPDGFSTVVLTDGTEIPLELWYMPVSRPYSPTPQPVAEAYATYLADIGIQVELKTEDWGVYLDNWDAGLKNGMVMLGWTGDYGDPNNFLFTHFGPGNEAEAGYANQELYDILTQAGSAPNQEAAATLFKQAGDIINRDIPRVPIVHAPPVFAQRAGLEGWVPAPTNGESFAPIFIEK
jgi:peptide/nickel transport system substrate-binding protein